MTNKGPRWGAEGRAGAAAPGRRRQAAREGAPAPRRKSDSPLCHHEELAFAAGGWHVRCLQCDQSWSATRPGPNGKQEPGLRAASASDLSEADVRRAP